jgi:hypothetical protein
VGTSEFTPGPPAAYQTVCFAIALFGLYPPIGS